MSTLEGTHVLIPLIGMFRAFLFHFALDILVNVNASEGTDRFATAHVSGREASYEEGRKHQVMSAVYGECSIIVRVG